MGLYLLPIFEYFVTINLDNKIINRRIYDKIFYSVFFNLLYFYFG